MTESQIISAIAHLPSTGGSVRIPAGIYNFTAPLPKLPPCSTLIGDGLGTILQFAGLPAGSAAITDGGRCVVEKMTLRGPGWNTPVGAMPATFDAWSPGQGSDGRDLQIELFRAGVCIRSDHNSFWNVGSNGNFYNIWFASNPISKGNHAFYSCRLDGPKFASVEVAGDNVIDHCIFEGGHVGFGPYGFHKSDNADGSPSTSGFISGTRITSMGFEAIGNAAILDASTGQCDSLMGFVWENQGFMWSPQFRLASAPADWAVQVRRVTSTRIVAGTYPVTTGAKGVYNATVSADWDIDTGTFGPQPFLFGGADGTTFSLNSGNATVRGGGLWEARVCQSVGTAKAGQLAADNGGWFQVEPLVGQTFWQGPPKPFAGVYLADAQDKGVALIAIRGVVPALCEPVGLGGWPLFAVAGSPHLNGNANGNPIAVSVGPGGAGGGGMMSVRIK